MEGASSVGIEEQRLFGDLPFPLVLSPNQQGPKRPEDLRPWVERNKGQIQEALLKHGAVLFRGFPVPSPEHFAEFALGLGRECFPYLGGNAVRRNIVGDVVFTANEAPPSEKIPWHHEMAQLPSYPTTLLFYCDLPPKSGGETPLVLSYRVLERVAAAHPGFVARLKQEGVKYIRVAPEEDDPTSALGRSWKSTFKAGTREEAEERMRADGFTWEWLPNGDLKTVSAPLQAVKPHPLTGRDQFFNQLIAAYTGWQDKRNDSKRAVVFAESGELLPEDAMAFCAQVSDEEAAACKWQQGDVILVDNLQAMHSRRTFEPPRRILASLLK